MHEIPVYIHRKTDGDDQKQADKGTQDAIYDGDEIGGSFDTIKIWGDCN